MLAARVHVFALNPALGTDILRLGRPSVPATAPTAAAAPDHLISSPQRRLTLWHSAASLHCDRASLRTGPSRTSVQYLLPLSVCVCRPLGKEQQGTQGGLSKVYTASALVCLRYAALWVNKSSKARRASLRSTLRTRAPQGPNSLGGNDGRVALQMVWNVRHVVSYR